MSEQVNKTLDLCNNITRLTRRLPHDKIIEMSNHDAFSNYGIKKLIKNENNIGHYNGNPDKCFSLIVSKNIEMRDWQSHLDIISGIYCPNIKEDQQIKITFTNHDTIIYDNVSNNKIVVPIYNMLPIINVVSMWTMKQIRIINADGSEDSEQEFYVIGCYNTVNYRNELYELMDQGGLNICIKNITLKYWNGIMMFQESTRINDLYNENPNALCFYKMRSAINVLHRLCVSIYNYKMKIKMEHKEKYQYVMMELEYMPDFGTLGIQAVENLNKHKFDEIMN